MTTPKSDWLVCMLVRAGEVYLGEPYCLGPIELTRRKEWNVDAERALQLSMSAFSIAAGRELLRARYFFANADAGSVRKLAALHLEQAMDVFRFATFAPVRATPLGAGFLMNLRSAQVEPFLPRRKEDPWRWPVFGIDEFATRDKTSIDILLAGSPERTGQLGERLRGSAHWHRQGLDATALSVRLLSLWIAAECICREDDDDHLPSKFIAGLGMPKGRLFQQLSSDIAAAYKAERDEINPWRDHLESLFERTRKLRNSIAHQGARELEVRAHLGEGDISMVVKALELLVPRLQTLALLGIARRMTTIAELWRSYGTLVNDAKCDMPPTADVVGTVIYSLKADRDSE